ncbi:hypothetical protein SANTM175S_07155 [Streptomyces antimycoticus]
MPDTSTGAGRFERVSGTVRTARIRPITATGTLTRKTARHPVPAMSAATSTPPRICPATMDRPAVAPYMLSARARRVPLVEEWIVASTWGSISAAEAPCATRAPTRLQASGASPQASEVSPKAAIPARKSLRRPKVSPSRPPRTSSTAYATPYPATTSSSTAGPAWRSWSMVGRATLTMKKSISGSAAPSSTVNSPRGLSAGPEEVWVRPVVFPPVVFAPVVFAPVVFVPAVFPVVFAVPGRRFSFVSWKSAFRSRLRRSWVAQAGTRVSLSWYQKYLATG